MEAPDLWQDQERATALTRHLSELKGSVATWRGLEREGKDLADLLELAMLEGDEALASDLSAGVATLSRRLGEHEFELLLSGEYDRGNAIMALHAGAGGTDAQDWAEIMLRMYLRWAEKRRFHADVLDVLPGDEAGIKSATVEIVGPYAYGYLKAERGVHRLVRLSPFDFDHARHTSFALVEVLPEVEEVEVSLNPDDLQIDVFRASGAGGQNVQKNATAVRITHVPTGIVASCQNERSLSKNKESAMKVLRARLIERELEQRDAERARLKGEHVVAGWGNQIRSYVLHPYKMVKDHRSDFETSNPDAVLDGDLDEMMEAYLRSQVGEE